MKMLLVIFLVSISTSLFAQVIPGVTGVRVITIDGEKANLITNAKGLTLYTFDPDGASESNCYDDCAVVWPPILLTPAEVKLVKGEFGTAKRKDGTTQLTYDSHPLYLFKNDKKPGDTLGDGLGGVWHIAIDE